MKRKKIGTYKNYDLYSLGKTNTQLNLEFVEVDGGKTIPFSIELKPAKLKSVSMDMNSGYFQCNPHPYRNALPANLPFNMDADMFIVEMNDVTCYADGKMVINNFSMSDTDYFPENLYNDNGKHVLTIQYPSIRRILDACLLLDAAIGHARDLGEATDFVDYVEKYKTISLATIYEGLFFYYEKLCNICFTKKK